MKIIYVTNESFIDHSYTIASELKKHIDLKVYMIAKAESSEIKDFCTLLGGNTTFVKRLRFRNPLNLILELKFLNFLRKQNYDLIWFNMFSIYQAIFVKLFVKKFLVNIHDAELHPEERNFHGIFSRWLTFKFHKKYVCLVSQTQASVFEKHFGIKTKIFQLPIIDYYEAMSDSKGADERNENKERGDKLIKFLFFGTILPYKGIEILLDASEILEKKSFKFVVYICGKIKYNEDILIERIKKLNYIYLKNEFISYRRLYDIFADADILILPYKQVTQCGPLLIAYNQNIPSICSNLPGFREYVDNEKSGLLFNGSAENLAEKMRMIINNPLLLEEMKNYISKKIKNKFSMVILYKQYISNLTVN